MRNFFSKFLLAMCCAMFGFCMTSCDNESRITFSFSLKCSEDLLDFVTPVVQYVDENDVLREVELLKSSFELVDQSEFSNHDFSAYKWRKQIVIKAETGQREMKVSYKLRSDAPLIDNNKTYKLYHSLSSVSVQSFGCGSPDVDVDSSITINGQDVNYKEVKGSDLQNYLDNLQNNPDVEMVTF